MALEGCLRGKCSKRISNVLKRERSNSEEMNFSSSDSETGVSIQKNKVRNRSSTKRLMKKSECYKVDSDHIYTGTKSPVTSNESKRKRKLSEESTEKPVKQKCFSKNAVMARLNRERKKRYVLSLEAENKSLHRENSEMRQKVENNNKTMFALRREILYLKGLLSNSKELGQILRNLSETTGLPITSSMTLTTETGSRETSEKSSLSHGEDNSPEEYQPRTRSVLAGANFPILDKDINLGSCSDKSIGELADIEHYPFDFKNEPYDLQPPFSNTDDSFFNLDSSNFDDDFMEPIKFQDSPKSRDPNVGICLHVNQKRVSVEICSICSSRGGSSEGLFANLF